VSRTNDDYAKPLRDAEDSELVRLARRGELPAFDVLVERYQRRATGLAYRLLNNRDDAMETTQEAFLKAFDKLGSLTRPERFGSWFLRIVSNLSLNRRRSRALRKSFPIAITTDENERAEINIADKAADSPLELTLAGDLQKKIVEVMHELPEMQREALILFSIEKLPQKEVARILSCSVEAVKWHVFTARKKLREKLKDYL